MCGPCSCTVGVRPPAPGCQRLGLVLVYVLLICLLCGHMLVGGGGCDGVTCLAPVWWGPLVGGFLVGWSCRSRDHGCQAWPAHHAAWSFQSPPTCLTHTRHDTATACLPHGWLLYAAGAGPRPPTAPSLLWGGRVHRWGPCLAAPAAAALHMSMPGVHTTVSVLLWCPLLPAAGAGFKLHGLVVIGAPAARPAGKQQPGHLT